jgi:hypothetical protein
MRMPGIWTVPGTLEKELTGGAESRGGREEFCARLLAGICRAAIGQRATLVNYTELPDAVCPRLAAYFGVEYSAGEWQEMRAAARFDAKSPGLTFEAGGRAVSPRVLEASARWVDGLYQELEGLRMSGQGLPIC